MFIGHDGPAFGGKAHGLAGAPVASISVVPRSLYIPLYLRLVSARGSGHLWLWIFASAMMAVEVYPAVAMRFAATIATAQIALFTYGVLALLAAFVDLSRAQAPA